MAFPTLWLSLNISESLERRLSKHVLASDRLTRRSAGFGRKISSRSPTTSMEGSVAPGCRLNANGTSLAFPSEVGIKSTHWHEEEVQVGVDGNQGDLGPVVFVGYAVERFKNRPCGSSDHPWTRREMSVSCFFTFPRERSLPTAVDGSIRHVNEEDVSERLGRSDHVLCWRYKVHDRMIEFRSLPPIRRLIVCLIPIEQLRDLIAQVTHAAFPSVSVFQESDVGVDVRSATTTASYHSVGNDGNGVLGFVLGLDGAIGRND